MIKAQVQVLKHIRKRIKQRQEGEENPYNRLVFGFKMVTIDAWLRWLIKQAKPFIKEVHDYG